MEPNSTLGEPIGVIHVTINGQKVPANVYADRTCIMPDGTIRKVKQEVVDALLAKKRAAEIPAQTPAQQAPLLNLLLPAFSLSLLFSPCSLPHLSPLFRLRRPRCSMAFLLMASLLHKLLDIKCL